ncbi:MAG: UDP-N-acetylglucosamine 2-epimerase [Desulfovibrio fairfieldensis]
MPNILLEAPLPYTAFVRLMDACTLILTDSGGIQEEGPSLNKPVLIMRDATERPEGIEAGVNKLVGTDTQHIFDEVVGLVSNPSGIAKMLESANPYGDGKAAQRIAEHLKIQ